jgi:hypothetical protein
MDTILASIHLACYISQFVELAAEILNERLENYRNGAKYNEYIDKLMQELVVKAAPVKFKLPDGVTFLSSEDEIFLRLVNRCDKLVLILSTGLESLQDADHLRGDITAEQEEVRRAECQDSRAMNPEKCDAVYAKTVLQEITKDLNETLAVVLWSSYTQEIRELGARDSRLNANRTEAIQLLSSEMDTAFQLIRSMRSITNQVSKIWTQILLAAQIGLDYSNEQTILSALQFWTMDRRKELIPKEHESTFQWVLAEDSTKGSSRQRVSFRDWLKTDERVYWISGKPGSGKSTLMKFIAENQETKNVLGQWAGNHKLVAASFYFWSSAKDPLQKSGTGLLRSLLFQILRQCPDLIKKAFPDYWLGNVSHGSLGPRFNAADLSTNELLTAYQNISGLLSTTQVKFCFFIDGLDEYDGQPADIIRLIELLSNTSNLKACISSRQWTEFENIFGGRNPWKLYVHQLTEADIKVYAEVMLGKDSGFGRMRKTAGENDVQTLVQMIVKKAEGVFLWVFLVVRSLLEGIQKPDQITDITRRLEEIPNDLENYFDKMLLDISASERQQTARIFEITLQATEKLPLMCYWFIREDNMESVRRMKVLPLEKEKATERLKQMTTQLDKCSLGLLTANTQNSFSPLSELEEEEWLFGFRVDFLHRTVADYLRTADMRKLLWNWSGESFNVDYEICKACLANIKITPAATPMFQDPERCVSIIDVLLSHARSLDNSAQVPVLDDFISTLRIHSDTLKHIQMTILGPGNYWAYDSSFNFTIMFHCISYGLEEYVILKLESGSLPFLEPTDALLSGCLSRDPRVRTGKFTLNLQTIEALLQKGLKPNLKWGDRNISFWQQLLITAYSNHLKGMATQIEFDAIKCSIDHGADQHTAIEVFSGRKLGNMHAAEVVEKILPREQYLALQR